MLHLPQACLVVAGMMLLSMAVGAGAVEAEDAATLWDEAYPEHSGAVRSVVVHNEPVPAGRPVAMSITFADDFEVERVSYQICEVGNACFAIGVPLDQDPDDPQTWHMSTRKLTEKSPLFDSPPRFEEGQRIGVQFFVYPPGTQEQNQTLFPEGLPDDDPSFRDDFVAWSETHYFATTFVAEPEGIPIVGSALVMALAVAVLLVAGRMRRP